MMRKPKVVILGTGGTIAGRAGSNTEMTGYQAGEIGIQTLINAVPEMLEVADVTGEQFCNIGSFDMIDDIDVTKALLAKVAEIGKENQLEYIEGPVGFSNLEKAGLLTFGFDKLATMVGLYNFPYYAQHLESLGFETANEWVEYELPAPTELPEKVIKFNRRKIKLWIIQNIFTF